MQAQDKKTIRRNKMLIFEWHANYLREVNSCLPDADLEESGLAFLFGHDPRDFAAITVRMALTRKFFRGGDRATNVGSFLRNLESTAELTEEQQEFLQCLKNIAARVDTKVHADITHDAMTINMSSAEEANRSLLDDISDITSLDVMDALMNGLIIHSDESKGERLRTLGASTVAMLMRDHWILPDKQNSLSAWGIVICALGLMEDCRTEKRLGDDFPGPLPPVWMSQTEGGAWPTGTTVISPRKD